MEGDRIVVGPRVLLIDGDLGRRATLGVALATRYAADVVDGPFAAHARAARRPFDLAVLDSATLGAATPRLIQVLRSRCRTIRPWTG